MKGYLTRNPHILGGGSIKVVITIGKQVKELEAEANKVFVDLMQNVLSQRHVW